jgi:hypothetical protein
MYTYVDPYPFLHWSIHGKWDIPKWGSIKWGQLPPNHPNLDHFSIVSYGFGDPPLEEIPIFSKMCPTLLSPAKVPNGSIPSPEL